MSTTNRKKLRLEDYDYKTNGTYFVTVCTSGKKKSLCRIVPANQPENSPCVILTQLGQIVEKAIRGIPGIDKYVIMPNHVHMIIISDQGRELSSIIRLWKSVIARQSKEQIWQKSYYDHVIRDEQDYLIKWKYIDDNPSKWASDEYYSDYEK